MMPKLYQGGLVLDRCPHCNIDQPTLSATSQIETTDFLGGNRRTWGIYRCARCGGVVTAAAPGWNHDIREMYPSGTDVDVAIPERARTFLTQAINSLSSPVGAVLLCASAVDAMFKAKNLRDGSLYSRIDKAAADHLIYGGRWLGGLTMLG
ncbi:MAG: hypothetical protein ACLPND_08295 [Candidatus Korobacteraceae bacterium]